MLARTGFANHMGGKMITREQWRAFIDHPIVEWTIFAIGVILLLLTPVVGALPGPGGVVIGGLGLAMVLKTSMWAKRHYVRFKRWQPRVMGRRMNPGTWTDWALRRQSAKRREEMRKQKELESGQVESKVD
ncbi:hypothetical protein [Sphingomonas lutea]|nr:hypothetical protein [Sphingomonas lutea]